MLEIGTPHFRAKLLSVSRCFRLDSLCGRRRLFRDHAVWLHIDFDRGLLGSLGFQILQFFLQRHEIQRENIELTSGRRHGADKCDDRGNGQRDDLKWKPSDERVISVLYPQTLKRRSSQKISHMSCENDASYLMGDGHSIFRLMFS